MSSSGSRTVFNYGSGSDFSQVTVPVPLVKKLRFLRFRFRFHNTDCVAWVPISTFMGLWAIYIFPGFLHTPHISCSRIGRSLTDMNRRNRDCGRAIPFPGIFVSNLGIGSFCSVEYKADILPTWEGPDLCPPPGPPGPQGWLPYSPIPYCTALHQQ
jgi:hypothetical protein